MLSSNFYPTVLAVVILSVTAFAHSENNDNNYRNLIRRLQGQPQDQQQTTEQPAFDFFDPNEDLCDNSADPLTDRPELGECDFSKFPTCADDEDICYNRKPSRDHFHPDNHQHKYYIQYDRVFCYPLTWGGCSSCTPGRYCASEKRCILEEEGYPCAQWF